MTPGGGCSGGGGLGRYIPFAVTRACCWCRVRPPERPRPRTAACGPLLCTHHTPLCPRRRAMVTGPHYRRTCAREETNEASATRRRDATTRAFHCTSPFGGVSLRVTAFHRREDRESNRALSLDAPSVLPSSSASSSSLRLLSSVPLAAPELVAFSSARASASPACESTTSGGEGVRQERSRVVAVTVSGSYAILDGGAARSGGAARRRLARLKMTSNCHKPRRGGAACR